MEFSGDVHIVATLLLGKVPTTCSGHARNRTSDQWLSGRRRIFSNWNGACIFCNSQIHVQEMAAQMYGDCAASQLQVWLITVWSSGCENVDIKNGCIENVIVIDKLKSVKIFCLWRKKR